MKPKLLICDKCGEPHTGEDTICPVCADGVLGHSVGNECCMCDDGHLVEAAVLPKSVADEQAAIVAAIERLKGADILPNSKGWSVVVGWIKPIYGPTLRAALEASVAAMEGSNV